MANKNGELFLVEYNNTLVSDKILDIFYRGGKKGGNILEKEHLKSISNLFTTKNDTNILTYIVRKDNSVLYKQNRYQVPKGTYRPGLEVELKISDGTMDIVDIETSKIIV